MRALSLLPAMLLIAACAASPAAPATAPSTEVPSGTAPSSAAPTLAPSPSAATTLAPSPSAATTLAPSPSAATTLENPRGSAINGPIFFSDKGDVFSLDPATGVRTVLVGGPTKDGGGPTPDGTKLIIFREDDGWLYISARDGSDLKRWAKGSEISAWNWSPDGSRLAAIPDGRTARDLIIWDGRTGPKLHLDVDAPANYPLWIDDETLLLVQEKDSLAVDYWTVKADGTGLRPLTALHPCCVGSVDPATGRLAYSDYVFNVSTSSSVHILNIATGADSILASTAVAGENYLGPQFSPDGKWVVAEQFAPGLPAHRPVLIAADGSGVALPLGPNPATNQITHVTFSPDSTRVLITREDGVYLFSIPDGAGGRVDWPMGSAGTEESPPAWQRLPE